MAQCQDIAPSITPPADSSLKEQILAILGVEEIEISSEDFDGDGKKLIVLGRVVEEDEP